MQGAENEQDQQTAQINREKSRSLRFCAAHLHCHPPAKKEGKKRVELCLHNKVDEHNDAAVERLDPITGAHGLTGKTAHIEKQNPEDREAAQDIHNLNAFF